MRISRCYHCGSEQHTFYAEENGYSLVKCDVCGILFVENRPDDTEISQGHEQGMHSGEESLDVTGKFNRGKVTRYNKVLGELFGADLDTKTTWLDVGCGHGEVMLAVQRLGGGKVTVKGTDPNIHKQESSRRRGLDVSYFDLESHEGRYDVISLLNVYSHLPDPPSFLETLKRLLTPAGEVVIETGDSADLSPEDQPRPLLLPDHLTFVSERVVAEILDHLGFEILKVRKYPFMRTDMSTIARELVKAVLPRHTSKIGCFFRGKNLRTDMFVRARMRA